MKYRNASEIFPDELLIEIQKYSSGELIYVPETTDRKNWGSKSGAREYYTRRNSEIRLKFHQNGKKISQLAEEYGLSTDTIRRILYK